MRIAATTLDTGTRRRAEAVLRAVLPLGVVFRAGDSDGPDLRFYIGARPLAVRWIGEGRLGAAREVIASDSPPDVVVARQMSPKAREELFSAGIGWADETGAAEFAVAEVVVSRTGRGQGPVRARRWTPSMLAVAEAILAGAAGTVAAMREATGLSEGACTNALRALTDIGLLTADARRGPRSHRRAENLPILLDAYATAAAMSAQGPSVTLGVVWQDALVGTAEVGQSLDALGVDWAATGLVASAVLAPHLTGFSTAEIYVAASTVAELHRLGEDLGLRAIKAGRLTLRPFPTATSRRYATQIGDLRIVHWPRAYADLREYGVRGEEAAEHLRETILGA